MTMQALTDNLSIVSGGADEVVPHVATKPNDRVLITSLKTDIHIVVLVWLAKIFGFHVPGVLITVQQTKLVPHMASEVNIVIEAPNNNIYGQQDGNSDGDLKPGALFAVGDCATSIAAIVSNPPSSSDPVYLVAIGIVLTAGVLAVLPALWVSRDARKRRTAKRKILYAFIAPFILGLVIDVYAYKVKK